MKSFSAVDKKGRRPSEIEMMKKQLKKVPGSDSEDEKVNDKLRFACRIESVIPLATLKGAPFFCIFNRYFMKVKRDIKLLLKNANRDKEKCK